MQFVGVLALRHYTMRIDFMNLLRSTVFLLTAVCCLRSASGDDRVVAQAPHVPVGTITAILEPMTHQVVQRRDDGVGNILVVGTYSGVVESFEASSIVQPGMRGTAVGWTPLIDVTILEGHFIGIFRQPAGGFYEMQIRPVLNGQTGKSVSVTSVGVGEVFITAGQSNSTNWGSSTGFYPDARVSCFNPGSQLGMDMTFPGASWRWGYDPQPTLDQSGGGSVWPTMASNLADALGVPIGLYSCGYTGTFILQWFPGEVMLPATAEAPKVVLFDHLTNAITYLNGRGGVRAVLWDQGETDYGYQTNPAFYQAGLQGIINESRAVTGVPIKWMVARAASPLTVALADRVAIEQAQASVVDYSLTFPGPDTDSIGLQYRLPSSLGPLHFNATGLVLLGGYWGIYVANLPGFLDVGALPPPR
jgi:eukaryotic-like serine/threonine-protein kinase